MSQPFGPITTPRLLLRPVAPSDRADLVALEADPEVMRFVNGGKPVPEEGDPDATFLTPRGHEAHVWAVIERATGAFLGWVTLRPSSEGEAAEEKVAELGYRLRRSAWGKGYATEAASAMVGAGFDRWGFDRITAETMAVNLASRRVLEKAGLRHVRTWFEDWPDPLTGAERGDVIYEVRRKEDVHLSRA